MAMLPLRTQQLPQLHQCRTLVSFSQLAVQARLFSASHRQLLLQRRATVLLATDGVHLNTAVLGLRKSQQVHRSSQPFPPSRPRLSRLLTAQRHTLHQPTPSHQAPRNPPLLWRLLQLHTLHQSHRPPLSQRQKPHHPAPQLHQHTPLHLPVVAAAAQVSATPTKCTPATAQPKPAGPLNPPGCPSTTPGPPT